MGGGGCFCAINTHLARNSFTHRKDSVFYCYPFPSSSCQQNGYGHWQSEKCASVRLSAGNARLRCLAVRNRFRGMVCMFVPTVPEWQLLRNKQISNPLILRRPWESEITGDMVRVWWIDCPRNKP